MHAALLLFLVLFWSSSLLADVDQDVAALSRDAAVLSNDTFEINSSFCGGKLLIFGVMNTDNCTVVAKITGPRYNLTISKRGSVYGAWLLEDVLRLADVDTFYAVAAHGDPAKLGILVDELQLGVENVHYDVVGGDVDRYKEFIGEYRAKKGLSGMFQDFGSPESVVEFLADRFFRVVVNIPKEAEAGDYVAEVYFIKNERVINRELLPFKIENSALDSAIKTMAYHHSFLYGLLVVFIPLLISWIMGMIWK